jgi:hypothetical protein
MTARCPSPARSSRFAAGAAAVVVLLVGSACSGGGGDDEAEGLPTEPFTLDVGVGECFQRPSSPDVADVRSVPCDEPHDFEAYALLELEGDGYPGAEEVDAEAAAACNDEFAGYVGVRPGQSGLVVVPVTPTAELWEEGGRSVTCTVTLRGPDRLESSVEGSEQPPA